MEEDELARKLSTLIEANKAYKEREAALRGEVRRLSQELQAVKVGNVDGGDTLPGKIDNASASQPSRRGPRRDLSLQSMVATWSGDPGSIPVSQFLEGLELVAACGNWEDADKSLVVRMRLKGLAASFLASRSDLRGPTATYDAIKIALEERFKDSLRPEQYLMRLSAIRQERGEGARAFADRCRALGEKSLQARSRPDEQGAAREQIGRVVLAAFMNGLKGDVGRFVRMCPPSSFAEAIEKASTIEIEVGNAEHAFAIEEDHGEETVKIVVGETKGTPGPAQVSCYRCGGRGHMARDCGTPRTVDIGGAPVRGRTTGSQRVTCYRCRKPGHVARDCRQRKESGHEQSSHPKESDLVQPREPGRF